jgi:hypothetical protein
MAVDPGWPAAGAKGPAFTDAAHMASPKHSTNTELREPRADAQAGIATFI